MVDVYIGIGSNIEPERNFQAVYVLLKDAFPSIEFSRTFRSEAVGFVGEDFHNSVGKFFIESNKESSKTDLNTVLALLKFIENQLGRKRGGEKFSARVIDIDILLFGNLVCDEPIQLPRGEVVENAYVLWPLSELAPDLVHPIENKTYANLWRDFDKSSQKLYAV